MDFALERIILCAAAVVVVVNGHGRLWEPPSRSSMWRLNYPVPANYDDNGLNCGGKYRQWDVNGGRCGVCGDPYDGERPNEAGGRYATGRIGQTYTAGQPITIEVQITSAHGGWFEFRLCPNNNPARAITQECLDRYLLADVSGSTRYQEVPYGGTAGAKDITLQYLLPLNLTCTQCVLQWKYRTGKDWGIDVYGTGLGHGNQEEFYGCADIAIRETSVPPLPTAATATIIKTTTTTKLPSPMTTNPTPTTTSRATSAGPPKTAATTASQFPGPTTEVSPASTKSTASTTSGNSHGVRSTATGKPTRPSTAEGILSCKGRGSLEGSLMDDRCRAMCLAGNCLLAFCNDNCHRLG